MQNKVGIVCGDKRWNQAGRRTATIVYLIIWTEDHGVVCSRKLHLSMDILKTTELWRLIVEAFIRPSKLFFLQENSRKANQSIKTIL